MSLAYPCLLLVLAVSFSNAQNRPLERRTVMQGSGSQVELVHQVKVNNQWVDERKLVFTTPESKKSKETNQGARASSDSSNGNTNVQPSHFYGRPPGGYQSQLEMIRPLREERMEKGSRSDSSGYFPLQDVFRKQDEKSQGSAPSVIGGGQTGQLPQVNPAQAKAESASPNSELNCSDDANTQTRSQDNRTDTPHIKYFGYYGSALEGIGNGNYINEVSDHSNLVWVGYSTDDDLNLRKIEQARQRGLKVVMDVQVYFFDGDYNLLPDFSKWDRFAEKLKPYLTGQDPTIIAFYPLDEPYMNGKVKGISYWDMKGRLELISEKIRSSFRGVVRDSAVKLAVIFSVGEIYSHAFNLPRNFDWFAFNAYDCWTKNCRFDLSIPEIHKRLKAQVARLRDSSQKRVFLLADAMAFGQGEPSPEFQNGIRDRARRYYELAANDPCVVAIVPFIYQSVPKIDLVGIEQMPLAKPVYVDMGRLVIGQGTGFADSNQQKNRINEKPQSGASSRPALQK